jgi:hypothetical protein
VSRLIKRTVPVRPDILPREVNFATRSRFKASWWRLGVATAPRTGALGLETPGNRVGGGSVSYLTAETLPFKTGRPLASVDILGCE